MSKRSGSTGPTRAATATAAPTPAINRNGRLATATPEECTLAFAAALSAGDLDAATACFAKDACLLTPDATAIRGREEIRPILAQLVAGRTQIEIEASTIRVGGDAALATQHWALRMSGPEGSELRRRHRATLVLQRLEGSWKLAIAEPWGPPPAT